MCRTYLLPSLALVLLLAVGTQAGGLGHECIDKFGECIAKESFFGVLNNLIRKNKKTLGVTTCLTTDIIQLDFVDKTKEHSCGPDEICCKLGKKQTNSSGRRKCDKKTPKKCSKQGGKCRGDCATLVRDGLCKSASCHCCIQEFKGYSPNSKADDHPGGFCVEKRKYCVKAGGKNIKNGCTNDKDSSLKSQYCYKEEFKWSYGLSFDKPGTGPDFWKDEYPICGLDRQSPIDIISADAVELTADVLPLEIARSDTVEPFEFIHFDDTPTSMRLNNNGHSVTCYWNDAKKPITLKGGLPSEYVLAQFHFHWGADSTKGSEHLIDGKAYPIELHMVHYKSDYGSLGEAVKYGDGLAVLGVMYEVGAENEALKPILAGLKDIVKKRETRADVKDTTIQYDIPLEDSLPADKSFYRYLGSLTTPGCNEVVVWTVFKEALTLSEAQLEEFRTLLDKNGNPIVDNFRPVLPLKGRTVYTFDV